MTSEIQQRADELKQTAQGCSTLNEFAKAVGWNMETARHANSVLALNLPDAKLKTGPVKVAQSCPKPVKKSAGGK